MALEHPRDKNERDLLKMIEPLGQSIQSSRNERHGILHAFATRGAKLSAEMLNEQRARATSMDPYPSRQNITFEELSNSQPSTFHRDECSRTFQRTKAWYVCLVHASSIVFEVEYKRR